MLTLAGLLPRTAQATHLRAGDIQARVDSITGNPNHIYFKMTLYRDPTKIDQQTVTIFYGDGTSSGRDAIRIATRNRVSDDTEIMTYFFDHTYPGSGSYLVSFIGENRVEQVVNMTGSVNQTFYISSLITIDPTLGLNHSPVLRAPAIDKGAVGQVFFHNPAAYDADGDSLAFRIMYSQQVLGGVDAGLSATAVGRNPNNVKCSGFVFPNEVVTTPPATQVTYPGIPRPISGTSATYTQDVHTGQITWNAPGRQGTYNVAMVVEEWRRTPGFRRKIGEVIRDMQIIVTTTQNLPPQLTVPADICVQAGQTATLTVSATDGQSTGVPPSPVTLFAYSGTIPPATFQQTRTGTSVTGTYTWQTQCQNVAKEPYLVVFKAQDSPGPGNPILIDERTVRVTVVGPPPQNLTAQTGPSNTAVLQWNPYACTNASQILIFRREGCYNYTPGPCDTGLPAGSGYVQVGAVPSTTTTFADGGLVRGRAYSYRIYAVFPLPAGGTSIVSNEACITLGGRSSFLTNVDVNLPNSNRQIAVKWTQPRNNNGTTTFTAPYGYRLSRALSTAPTNFTLVTDVKNSISDTTFVDTGVDTENSQYIYQLVFYRTDTSNGTPVEAADAPSTASSVRTSLVANGIANTIAVNFAYQVPWDNSKLPARVFRRTGTTGAYAPIGTVTPGATSGSYVDSDPTLQRNQTYCY